MAGRRNVGSWVRPDYPIYIWARFISILWAYHTFILAKCRIKYILRGRRSSAGLFSGFAAISAVTGAVATADLFLLVSLLSMLPLVSVIGDLNYLLLGWPGSLAGWRVCGSGLSDSVGFLGAWRLRLRWPAFIFECGQCGQVALQGLQIQFLLAPN